MIDETGMVGTRQLARVLVLAEAARAKVVLVGDPEQLQAIEAGAPFRAVLGQSGQAELLEVKRQNHDWQREATQQLASGKTAEALMAYESQGDVVQVATRDEARQALLARWAKAGQSEPNANRLMLAYTRDDVHELNRLARTLRQQQGQLGAAEPITTERGHKDFAVHDRLYFLRNEKSLRVKNGSLGTIESIDAGVLRVRLDGKEKSITVDTRFYKDLDYGYATTVHKAQASTVDRAFLLATPHCDRHSTYVALSRHRESATVFYAAEDFGTPPGADIDRERVRARFLEVLSRSRPKELVHDYLERETPEPPSAERSTTHRPGIDDLRRQGREAWLAMRAESKAREQESQPWSLEEHKRQAREAWLRMREQGLAAPKKNPDHEQTHDHGYGIEDDFAD